MAVGLHVDEAGDFAVGGEGQGISHEHGDPIVAGDLKDFATDDVQVGTFQLLSKALLTSALEASSSEFII